MQRQQFIKSLFNWLKGKEYVWLKALPDFPEQTPLHSDIDIFISKNNLSKVLEFVKIQKDILKVDVTGKKEVVFLDLVFEDGSALKLDLLTRLFRKQWTYLTEDYLLDNRIERNGVTTYSNRILLEHVLLFNFLNKSGLPEKYVAYFSKMDQFEKKELLDFINKKYKTDFFSFQDMSDYSELNRKKIINSLKNNPANGFSNRMKNMLGYLRQKIANNNNTTAKVITFSGVDGAGKTTLLNDLKMELSEHRHKKVIVLRHRPSVLPILSAWTKGKKAAEAKAATTLPRQGNNGSQISSFLRFAYYYADYLFGQIYIWLRYTLPGYTIIYDRYYFDFIVDGKRSNISLGEKFPKWLYRFVFKPSLNIFLYADPSVILQRKKELSADDITGMTGRYKSLFHELKNNYSEQYVCIENIDRQKSLQTILSHI